jgi:hypothetical protein
LIASPGQTGRLRRGNRLDQARIVVPDVADARAHRPANHVIRRVGGQQRLELRHVDGFFAEPGRPCVGLQDHRHAIVDFGAELIRRGGDDREAADPFAGRRVPVLPHTRERHDAAIGERKRIRLLSGRRLLPFVKRVDRYQAAPALERLAESRLALDPLGLGVDVGETDLDVLGPIRDQAPAQRVEAALRGLGVVADDGQGVGRRHVPARRKIWGRPLGRDRENELDLADVGGQAGAATHGSTMGQANRAARPRRACREVQFGGVPR